MMEEYVFEVEGTYTKKKQPIIRCRDCKHCTFNAESDFLCGLHRGIGYFEVDPNGFCAWGER